jgi:hypothetical protein
MKGRIGQLDEHAVVRQLANRFRDAGAARQPDEQGRQ